MSPASVQASFTALIGTYGESLTLNRGGVNRTVNAIFEPANRAVQETYFDDNALVGLVQPCLQAFFDATMSGTSGTLGAPAINDTFTRDGRPLTIQKVQPHRLGGTVILYTALCD